jgi:hypothetical protein
VQFAKRSIVVSHMIVHQGFRKFQPEQQFESTTQAQVRNQDSLGQQIALLIRISDASRAGFTCFVPQPQSWVLNLECHIISDLLFDIKFITSSSLRTHMCQCSAFRREKLSVSALVPGVRKIQLRPTVPQLHLRRAPLSRPLRLSVEVS